MVKDVKGAKGKLISCSIFEQKKTPKHPFHKKQKKGSNIAVAESGSLLLKRNKAIWVKALKRKKQRVTEGFKFFFFSYPNYKYPSINNTGLRSVG